MTILALTAAGGGRAGEAAKCKLGKLGTLNLTMDGNMPLLDATVNDQKVYLLMDTGAALSLITKPATDRLQLTRHAVPFASVEGVGGRAQLYVARVKELKLGEWTARNIDMPVSSNHDIGAPDIAGILGENFLSQFDLDIDIAHNSVVLLKAMDCDDDTPLVLWQGNYADADIGRSQQGNPKIWLTVKLNGQDVHAILDTGAYTSVLTQRAAERAGIKPDSPGVTRSGGSQGIGDNEVQDYVGVFDSFELGDEQIKHVRLRFGDLFEHRGYNVPEMLLGLDFLRAHRVMVAHSQRKIYFTYLGGPVFQVTGPRLRRVTEDPTPAPPEGTTEGAADDRGTRPEDEHKP
ncbi:MAG: retroviral-like aspartic protease family protein [Azospirillaceae bacterium]|nr:retroviral-like aspartic protease family protein [Azospirillaceae bacterium]